MEMGELNLGVQENASAMLMAFTEKGTQRLVVPDRATLFILPQ